MEFLKSALKSERLKKVKELKKDQLVILLLFGVLLLVIALPVSTDQEEEEETQAQSGQELPEDGAAEGQEEESYEERQEKRLREILGKVEGVGKVEVMITLESTSEKVVEKDQPVTSQTVEEADSGGGTRSTREESWSESTVYSESGDGERSPYVVKELEPVVQGVIVIAQGGGSAAVKQDILEAVQALFPIEAHKIKIMKMEDAK